MPIELTQPQTVEPDYDVQLEYQENRTQEVIDRIRILASATSPLTELFEYPKLARSLSKSSSKKDPGRHSEHRSTSSHSRKRKSKGSSSVLNLVLTQQDFQIQQLKSVLHEAAAWLEYESQRAESAEAHALEAKYSAADTESTRSGEGKRAQVVKPHNLELEATERQLNRVESFVAKLRRKSRDVMRIDMKAGDIANQSGRTSKEGSNKEDSGEETRSMESDREDSWQDGHRDGYEQGWADGYGAGAEASEQEGFLKGLQEGREEGRRSAMEALDKFMEAEMGLGCESEYSREERVQRWSDSLGSYDPSWRPIHSHRARSRTRR